MELNPAFNVLTVNFNSTENNSAEHVDLCPASTASAVSLRFVLLFEMAQIIHLLRLLLKTSQNDNFVKIQRWVECVYWTIANNIHFWIGKSQAACCCFEIKINSEGNITQVLKIALKIHYLTIVKGVCYASFCRTNRQMFFHVVIAFSEKMLTIMALFDRSMINFVIPFFKLAQITSIGKIDLTCKVARNRQIFIECLVV